MKKIELVKVFLCSIAWVHIRWSMAILEESSKSNAQGIFSNYQSWFWHETVPCGNARTCRSFRRFLSISTHSSTNLSKFLPNRSTHLEPLYRLTKKNFQWISGAEEYASSIDRIHKWRLSNYSFVFIYFYASQYKWGWVSRQTVELGLQGGKK